MSLLTDWLQRSSSYGHKRSVITGDCIVTYRYTRNSRLWTKRFTRFDAARDFAEVGKGKWDFYFIHHDHVLVEEA